MSIKNMGTVGKNYRSKIKYVLTEMKSVFHFRGLTQVRKESIVPKMGKQKSLKLKYK